MLINSAISTETLGPSFSRQKIFSHMSNAFMIYLSKDLVDIKKDFIGCEWYELDDSGLWWHDRRYQKFT